MSGRDLAVERPDEGTGDDGEEDDAVGEDEPVAAVGELARQEAVFGDDARQAGEVGIGGVGGENEDGEGGDLGDPEQKSLASVHLLRHQAIPVGIVLAADRLEVRGEHRDAEEAGTEDGPHDHDRGCGVLALRLLERRHTVRIRPRHRRAPPHPRRTARSSIISPRLLVPSDSSTASSLTLRVDLVDVLEDEDPHQPDHDEGDERET